MTLPAVLRDLHLRLGARLDSSEPQARVAGYAPLEDEYRAVREGCALLDRSDRGKLQVTGSERVEFLHGMLSNDVRGLAENAGCLATLLTVKGRMVADLRVLRRPDAVLLDCEPGRQAAVDEQLQRHLISEDAEVADVTGERALIAVIGPRAGEAVRAILGRPAPDLQEHQVVEVAEKTSVIGLRLDGRPGYEFLLDMASAPAWVAMALERGAGEGLRPVGLEAMEVVRVEEGLPRFGKELSEETIPLEAGLERAISYDKGCYLGQEVIARASYRGAVRRRLAGFDLHAAPSARPGDALFEAPGDSKPAGELTSVVLRPRHGLIGLGYVRREHLLAEELFTAEGGQARIVALPFERG